MLPQDAIIQKNETERVDYFIKQNSHKISQITPYLKHDIKDYIKYLELRSRNELYSCNGGHAVIADGTDDNETKLLCHYGWSGYSQILLSRTLSRQLWLVGLKPWGVKKTTREHFFTNIDTKISGMDIGEIYKYEKMKIKFNTIKFS
ncbi:hypothetical protein JN00_0554 [Metamycoplasma subdolum]|uniref:Uncharacterized protein n=1 Tax=Metamycoplasma subdolum TaxID=92407 RepID=A0A3L9ZZ81_9BACT|nr:hypothetical protein [Metamycoplasma subdolum]RMA77444.1 hypothetical protein JN00_0554 [Metamycoplasma subdolum]WPB50327.1 hypothetical protein R9C05_01825 [Metamycoplasma subdolum]